LAEALFAWPRAILRHPLRSLTIAALVLLIGGGLSIAGVWLWASYHLRAGRAALERYHTTEAGLHLHAALRVWPRDPETLLLAARAARRAGAFEVAEHFLNRYQEQRKEDDALALERICLRAERGEPDSVSNYCRKMVEQNDPATPLLFEALAQGYSRIYQPSKAEMVLNVWLEQDPENPQALSLLGQIYEMESRNADAIRSYRTALTADQSLDEVRLRLCDAMMGLGSFEETKPHLLYLRGRMPDNPKVEVLLARIEDREGHSEEAERILEGVLAHQPNFAPALLDRGILALRAGQFAQAENYLREAVQLDPSDYQAHDRLAFCLEQVGKAAEADKEREHIRQMEKDLRDIQDLAKGQLERTPHDAKLHYQIGMISMRAGAVKEALRWLNSTLREDPNHQGAHKALMEYYQRNGDAVKAREHRQKLIK
jgi:Tfp pilus assembly protein PilF